MTTADQISAARDQLNRTLTFFPRVDTKASVMFGVNTGLLAVLATKGLPPFVLTWEWLPIGLAALLLAISFWHLYQEAFPALDGGDDSLLYFREIAKISESRYVDRWLALSDEDYLKDLLGQIWRNAEILRQKFNHARWAFYTLALAVLPWLIAMVALTIRTWPQ